MKWEKKSRKHPELCVVLHRGEILKKAIDDSGYPISQLSKRLGKSRKWFYLQFENPAVQIDYLLQIGRIIHFDFTTDLKELRPYLQGDSAPMVAIDPVTTYNQPDADYWKTKYVELLERYTNLLEAKL